jgi:hypothetical protein
LTAGEEQDCAGGRSLASAQLATGEKQAGCRLATVMAAGE